jgi:hypothetical protein
MALLFLVTAADAAVAADRSVQKDWGKEKSPGAEAQG